jgi:phospholipid/cholesterol/gamma-HCH transport system substrate-binding protein
MNKEIKIGIIMVIVLGSVIWGVNFLKGKNFFSNTKNYYVIYDEVNGLLESNGVFIKGFKVGHVGDIGFSDKTLKKLRVVLAISSDVKIPRKSKARIYSVDLLGTKAVELLFTDNEKNLRPGDTLVGDIEVSVVKQLEPYKVQAYKLLNSMDSLSSAVLRVFNSNTVKNLHETFKNIKETTDALANSTDVIGGTFSNIESITKNLKENNRQISAILKNLENLTDTLSQLKLQKSINDFNQTLEGTSEILANLKSGHGTMGKLITNDSLYNALVRSMSSLDSLLIDLKKRPNRYVQFSIFGKRNK